jgi:hypothetical protein
MGKKHKKPSIEKLESNMDSLTATLRENPTLMGESNSTTTLTMEAPLTKPTQTKEQDSITCKGKYLGGVLECDVVKSSMDLGRLQRIILKVDGRSYEYTRTHIF